MFWKQKVCSLDTAFVVGVFVLLEDNSIGYVLQVLNANAELPDGDAVGSSAALQNKTSGAFKASKRSIRRKKKAGKSTTKAANATVSDNACAMAASGGGSYDSLNACVLDSQFGDGTQYCDRAKGSDPTRDRQLWLKFEQLQKQHGDGLTNAMLEECGYDFEAAIKELQGQTRAMQEQVKAGDCRTKPDAATCEKGKSGDDGDTSEFWGQVDTAWQSAGNTVPQPSTRMQTTAALDEALVCQLAADARLDAAAAAQLCSMFSHTPPAVVVQALTKQGGNVQLAADALLTGQGGTATAEHDSMVAATATASHQPSPAAASAAVALTRSDPALVVGVQQLQDMFPVLERDMAEVLMQQHHGNVQAVSEMTCTWQLVMAFSCESLSAAHARVCHECHSNKEHHLHRCVLCNKCFANESYQLTELISGCAGCSLPV